MRPDVPPYSEIANTPVSSAPTIPPTPCTPKQSSASSAPSIRLRPESHQQQNTPAATPMAIEPTGPTKPDAGVMATSPATAPEQIPITVGLPRIIHSTIIQVNAGTAV